ncbi:hypothetical protein [Leptothoe sp. PORK10 BA2]|uniref:hypothetical protein n=1 Tax=Leptothoe sp. PORK10 BA2 TaxID=3110254 RepID=UPI002B210FD3|nr:hypothetical protein [Leptothoe sp. PORK10 BA2]MEA5467145.1 hypothetical protein [Leptothoe sp. PORK10 BA2]
MAHVVVIGAGLGGLLIRPPEQTPLPDGVGDKARLILLNDGSGLLPLAEARNRVSEVGL